ncbi:TlpA disulfide reductase family protein [Stenoxybacter acetivorans]|uniref:TlpA disulfide reductase family protein n=1 Tax=Stenoxybacter acetivorans TaxID=422441 RepID=UPI0005620D12|nr:TlpA disulfide reductase family protein [Stenoxybacter acetivorans]
MKKWLSVLIAAVLAAAVALILWPSAPKAADFSLVDLNGKTVNQTHLQDKVTLINFWYPSCPGCVSEMPKLIKMAHDYQNQSAFQIIGIALPYDPESSVRNYAATRNLPFQVAIDTNNQVGKAYGVEVAPTSVLVNRSGEVVKTFVGEPDFGALYRQVDVLLK